MTGRKVFEWTAEADAMLKTLYMDQGLSGSQIAATLGGGLTRSAVQGRLSRLGLKKGERTAKPSLPAKPARPKLPRPAPAPVLDRPKAPKGGPKAPPEPEPTAPEPTAPDLAVPAPEPRLDRPKGLIPAMEAVAAGRCKAPLGEPDKADFAFCGDPVGPGGTYCPVHERLFYRSAAGRG
jgi:GcrA cell cycle regulator